MGIMDRLGSVIKSYFVSDGDVHERRFYKTHSDPDLDSAFEELDDFLNEKKTGKEYFDQEEPDRNRKTKYATEEIKRDFAELGLTPEATAEECKEAYKRLLKIHHPDRHAKHQGNTSKATEKTTRVNAAYERLKNWYKE